jgi:hypothetical protein
MATITAANAVFMLSIANLYPTPVKLQGFATDDAFLIDPSEMAQTEMGVDGKMSAGWVPYISKMTISLQADSIAMGVFMGWIAAMNQAKEVLPATGSIHLKAVSTQYELRNGILVLGTQMPEVKKLLGPQKFTVHWEVANAIPSL